MTSQLDDRLAVHFGRRRYGRRPGLHRMRALTGLLGDPQHRYRCLHVTGTNGKTTVTRLASAVLEGHGLRVGAFTSPHLEDVRERIVVDGEPVTETALLAALDRVEAAVAVVEARLREPVTFFELMTAAACVLFADAGVDVAVVEVGIGGRLDPTNVHHGDVAVVASVGLDHPELGSTTAQVAAEKAGIFEPGATALVGPMDPAASAVVTERAAAVGTRLLTYGEHVEVVARRDARAGQDLAVRLAGTEHRLWIALRGVHQAVNAALALAAGAAVLGPDRPLDVARTREALLRARVPGRTERLAYAGRPEVVLDVAHNEDAARALADTMATWGRGVPLALVVGASPGRDLERFVRPLLPLTSAAYLVTSDAPDGHPGAAGLPRSLAPVDSVTRALTAAERQVGPDGRILVTGTHRLVAAARELLRQEWSPGRSPQVA
ncbi:folylpolyglutamate synthase/dihydrofolate synthase family protein [Egicoccus sp. AB-alg2]|uniref:bifunctional folylpolyglutamate synthase/dihydrofolate synthase n=1 Tax=Egicoccus sp. AB-alg2 TaxID=3242693 RepID=UPI00359E812D